VWRAWLEQHHADESGLWPAFCKVGSGKAGVTYEVAVEEALCFGWIDGLLRSIDGETFALRYSPRRRHSIWSDSNKRRVERLIAEGRMAAAGLQKVAEAKENGEWDAATARENVDAVPADLAQGLERDGLSAAFERWPASRRKSYLYWLSSAKKPETRQRRIQAICDLLWPGPDRSGNEGEEPSE
jgi:uncharacterized protein YdeI (YjbR/CyaY-like superfamily)